ncbi:MAG: hypothetical protein ACRYFW_13330 [Janthinobacterium lividum]
MIPFALMIVQTGVSAAPEPGSALSSISRPCAAGPNLDGDVVVCARARDADRLKPPAPLDGEQTKRFDPLLVRLPGGSTARLHAFQRELPGATSQGAAVTFTVPLGTRK